MSSIVTAPRTSVVTSLGGIVKTGPSWTANHPNPHLYSIIALLWNMLDLVRVDWEREVLPRQQAYNLAETTNQRTILAAVAVADLQPYFLKCLFSYITFFVSLRHAYSLFYADLNRLNRLPVFQVRHPKLPRPDAYIRKVHMVRDISLVHFGSTIVPEADSAAGLLWQPMSSSGTADAWDLGRITFRPGRVVVRDHAGAIIGESADLEINGMHELDLHCAAFLRQCDAVCADYLRALQSRLPCESNGYSYKQRR